MSAGKRLDISSFRPSDNWKRAEGREIETGVHTFGGGLWGPPNSPDERGPGLARAIELAPYVRLRLGVGHTDVRSVALVDWSALNRTCALLGSDASLQDPFVSLADFSSILAACVFYDRVVVLDQTGTLDRRANEAMGLDGVVVSLRPDAGDSAMAFLLDHHYSWSWHYFDRATKSGSQWLTWLQEFWAELLPGVSFPQHAAAAFEGELGYNTSPQRESWIDVVFRSPHDEWLLAPHDSDRLILDNDIRALVYERLAQTFDSMLGDGAGSVRYVGGCLRSPLLLARAKDAEARLLDAPAVEDWLLEQWVARYRSVGGTVRLPFWAGAVLARSKGDRRALPDEIARCRRQAARLRKRKAELEAALRAADESGLRELESAVRGELEYLADWVEGTVEIGAGAVSAVAVAALQTHAPGVPTEVMEPAKKAASVMGGSAWLKGLALRLFRPHVSFVFELARDGALRDALRVAAPVFGLGGRVATQPEEFLTRLGRTRWIT